MTKISVLRDTTTWQQDFEGRLRASYTAAGLGTAALDRRLDEIHTGIDGWTVAEILDAGTRVGHVAVAVADDGGVLVGRIGDLHVQPAHSGRGHERAARDWAETWCARQGARRVDIRLPGPAGELFEDYGIRGQLRMRRVDAAPEPVDGVLARPMTSAEFPEWLASEQASYTAGIVRAGGMNHEDAARKSDRDFAELLGQGLTTPGNTFLVLEAAGEPIGTGWLKHGHLPDITYGYALHVHEEHRGKGYGRAAMAAGEQATLAAGDHALMFTVWGGNDVAMNLYTRAGYRIVEENRFLDLDGPGER